MMRIKIHVVILFAFLSKISNAQYASSGNNDDLRKAVYAALIDDFCKEKTWAYVMDDTTRNHYIFQWPPSRYIDYFDNTLFGAGFKLDSLWRPFLEKVDAALGTVKKVRVPEFSSIAKIYLLNSDSIRAKDRHGEGRAMYEGMGWMKAKLTVSDIIFSSNKEMAIVEFSQYCGSVCGSGKLVLLQRGQDKRWKVVYNIGLWVS